MKKKPTSDERLIRMAQNMVAAGVLVPTAMMESDNSVELTSTQPLNFNGMSLSSGDIILMNYTITTDSTTASYVYPSFSSTLTGVQSTIGPRAPSPKWFADMIENQQFAENERRRAEAKALRDRMTTERVRKNLMLYRNNFRPQEGEQLELVKAA